MNETVTILLATYNGEKYLSNQLDSIINQTYTNWHLLIRDDQSTDNTAAVIKQYQSANPQRITILKNNEGNGGSIVNFDALLQAATTASYIMFCDQDDEWKKDKIKITFFKLHELERQYGKERPLLVYTNFQYVDEEMKIIESKRNFDINRIENFGFSHLLAQNPVYGCTTIINRALADKVGDIPAQAENHDYWIALVAAAFGKLYYLNNKTILYRQHASNVSGNYNNNSIKKRIQRTVINKKNFKDAKAKYAMLTTFKTMYNEALNQRQQYILNNFLCSFTHKSFLCILKNIKAGVRSQTLAQSVLLYITIFFTKNVSVQESDSNKNSCSHQHLT